MGLNSVDWRKSSRSGGGGGNCVELAVIQKGSSQG
ncbi:DUF397 domain-containing protein [Actinoallomurus purpureus]|nr:DUF397 domain-containing protein [Actinoallomurus purpureus]MCO6009304.1 DUF397 domain-containing protein [Actinoallomurus purpureus]